MNTSAPSANGLFVVTTPRMGERLNAAAPHRGEPWWRAAAEEMEREATLCRLRQPLTSTATNQP